MNFKFLNIVFLRAAALSLPLAAAMPCAPVDGAPAKPDVIPQIDPRGFTSPAPWMIETEELDIDLAQSGFGQMTHDAPERPPELLHCIKSPFSDDQLKKINAALGAVNEWFKANGLRDSDGLKSRVIPADRDQVESAMHVIRRFDKVYAPGTQAGFEFLKKDPIAVLMLTEDYAGYSDVLTQILSKAETQEFTDIIEPLFQQMAKETQEGEIDIDDQASNACADKGGIDFLDRLSVSKPPFTVLRALMP